MAHSLTLTPATTITPISANSKILSSLPSLGFLRTIACHGDSKPFSDNKLVHRRFVPTCCRPMTPDLNIGGWDANAARRPPPPPPEAKLREKGKAINEPSE
ncbi:hypothetical protein NC651_040403 [Populus alba x Populus x berolinensis]|nr:hypothetical protein NC651_040403 [Populus alba x Populus x berolinensis]